MLAVRHPFIKTTHPNNNRVCRVALSGHDFVAGEAPNERADLRARIYARKLLASRRREEANCTAASFGNQERVDRAKSL